MGRSGKARPTKGPSRSHWAGQEWLSRKHSQLRERLTAKLYLLLCLLCVLPGPFPCAPLGLGAHGGSSGGAGKREAKPELLLHLPSHLLMPLPPPVCAARPMGAHGHGSMSKQKASGLLVPLPPCAPMGLGVHGGADLASCFLAPLLPSPCAHKGL